MRLILLIPKIVPAAALAALCLAATVARADLINLGIYSPGSPSDAETQLNALNTQINLYNADNDPDLPLATGQSGSNFDTPGDLKSIEIDLSGSCRYLLLKWDNKFQFYYIEGISGLTAFESTVFNDNDQPQGLSHYALFDCQSVPDGGTTVVLLGLALTGLSLVRRRLL